MHTIVIIGGGFGGVRLAQRLSHVSGVHIKLIDPKTYMQYYAANYRLATGGSALETCISYASLLKGDNVEHVKDAVASVDTAAGVAVGVSGSRYAYDTLVVASGSESSFFGIPGADEHSFGIRTADESLKLRTHMTEVFRAATTATPEEKTALLHFIVIGGGATGVELASELPAYTKKLAKIHGVDPSLITIDLIEAMPRVLGLLSERVSAKVLKRLHALGINVFLNRSVIREETAELVMKDMQMKSKTIIWTAGMKAARVTSSLAGLALDKRGRIVVDDRMHAQGFDNVFAIGDAASTKYSGMAQTAVADADYVAGAIAARVSAKSVAPYAQPMPAYSVPVGTGWAATVYHGITTFGRLGWMMRRAADLRAFLMFLPPKQAWAAFRAG